MEIEKVIVDNLICNDDFARKALPFLANDYFRSSTEKQLYDLINSFMKKYNQRPSRDILEVSLESLSLSQDDYSALSERIKGIDNVKAANTEWLLDETEKYCRDKALFDAINKSIEIYKEEGNVQRAAIPDIVSKALALSFQSEVGHDFFDDAEQRYDFFHQTQYKLPFDIDLLNEITKGGLNKKTLNFIMAASGVGKTALMCHFAASNLQQGKNVLYITLEMSEEQISRRVEANLLNISINDLDLLSKDLYLSKIKSLRTKTAGNFKVEEFPTSSGHTGHFRHLINELKLKKQFIPDVIYIDYLGICASSKLKPGATGGSYGYYKSVAEEIRALAVELGVPIVTAMQFNRDGYDTSDVGLLATSESMGIVHTADLILALISTEELENAGQLMIKQLKNRYNDMNIHKRFIVGIDRSRMKLYNLNQNDNQSSDDDDDSNCTIRL